MLAIRTQLSAHLRENLKTLGLKRFSKALTVTDVLNGQDEAAATQNAEGMQMSSAALRSCVVQPLTTNSGQSDARQNPFRKSVIEPLPDGWRRTKRRYCSNRCKLDGYALRRARALLNKVGSIEFHGSWIEDEPRISEQVR